MEISFEKKIILLFLGILIGIVVAGIVTFRNCESVRDTDYLVQHTREVLYESEEVLSLTQDILLGSRGYVITGDSVFLEPFHKASHDINKSFARLENLVKDNPQQQQRADTLNMLNGERIKWSVQMINLRKYKGFAEAQQWVATRNGKFIMDKTRNTIRAIQQEENKLMKEQQEANQESHAAFNRSFYFLLGSILLLVIVVMVAVMHNLKIRKQAEEELFIKNEWYNQTLISMGDGVITIDANGIIALINKAACEILGWSPEEVIGSHVNRVFEITNEQTGLKVMNPVMEAMQKNEIIWLANHTILKRKDGSSLFIDDSGAPIHNQEGEVIGGVLIFRDVTEKKKAEEESSKLKAEEESSKLKKELELIINSIPDGVHGINKDGMIIFENPAAYQMLGWEQNDLIGNPAHATIHHTFPNGLPYPVADCSIYATIKDGIVRNVENESFWRKDGTSFPVSYTSSPLLNEANEIIGAIVTFRDITERKKVEAELEQTSAALKEIEWLLSPRDFSKENFVPVYGDITKHNTNRTILDAVGAEMLESIVNDFMKMLGTSSAVYEKNGDYAMGIFSSGWCRSMDQASYKLCKTDDVISALNCGKWHCHESCWNKASRPSIESGKINDIECDGGIHLYAAPIKAGDEIVGSINFGYGNPPENPEKINELSLKYNLEKSELVHQAREYKKRPQFIIDYAKTRLQSAADFIGLMVERKKAEEELLAYKNELEKKVIERTEKLASSKKELRELYEKLVKSESEIRNFAKHLNQVMEDERSHIAREIHDEIGQQLAGMKISFIHLKTSENGDKVQEMIKNVDGLIQSLRKIATQLRPGILDTLGLIPSIEWLAKEFENKTKIKCRLITNGDEEKFANNISTCFFRICQESLTNISKHAQASEVTIEINKINQELLLRIIDNGKGIASEKLENPFSMGLLGMRERANLIGADFKISSKTGSGTTVQLIAKIN